MVLYENTVSNFVSSVCSGTLSRFLEDEYAAVTGIRPDPLTRANWKYRMRLIYEYLIADQAGPEGGIRIDLCQNSLQTSMMLVLASRKKTKENVAVLQMLPWESVRLSSEEDMVICTDDTGEHEVIHPSYQILEYTKYLSRGYADENLRFSSFVYLYECPQLRETDIETNYREELVRKAPIVYADNSEEFSALTEEVLTGDHGQEVLRHLHMLEERPLRDSTGGLFDDQKYIYSIAHRYLSMGRPAWILVRNPAGSGGDRLGKELQKLSGTLPGKITVIRKGEKPAAGKFRPDGVTVWFHDEFEDPAKIDAVVERANREKVPVHRFTLHVPAALPDNGSGLLFLAELIGLSEDQENSWDPERYSIVIAEGDEKIPRGEKIAEVTIGPELRYDPGSGRVLGSREEKRKLYEKLSRGRKGVILHVEDAPLREYMKEKVRGAAAKNQWIRQYVSSFGKDEIPAEVPADPAEQTRERTREIRDFMGEEAWQKMTEPSRTWIVSGVAAYYEMKEYDQLLDFSGVCVQICKAAEEELTIRLFTGFRDWLKEKYGEQAVAKAPYEMIQGRKNGNRFITPDRVSIGQFFYFAGMDCRGKITDAYAWGEFSEYASEKLLKKGLDPKSTMREHLGYIEKIRAEYRNQAAHGESVDVTRAKACIDFVVGTLHRLGVMLCDYTF